MDRVTDFVALFPKLRGSGHRVASPPDDVYNCIAWAAGDTERWWWPDPHGNEFWPAAAPRAETLPAFQQAFALLGYAACSHEGSEEGFEKVALFADAQGVPRHAARQLPDGQGTSKMGLLEDMEHRLHDLEGKEYGSVAVVLRRPIPAAESEEIEEPRE